MTDAPAMEESELRMRVYDAPGKPTLIYIPGIHGDWTLVSSFRAAMHGKVRFVEVTYPRNTKWTLAEYAQAMFAELAKSGIGEGWLLGESFGSQVVWAMLEHRPPQFSIRGIILAGGFVNYPVGWMLRLAKAVLPRIKIQTLRFLLRGYVRYARFRHRRAPETLASMNEFMERRTESDWKAICHRLDLIQGADFSHVARDCAVPVFQLMGFFDPIVFWPPVKTWLRRERGGPTEHRLIWLADHNVLSTDPAGSACQIEKWITGRKQEKGDEKIVRPARLGT